MITEYVYSAVNCAGYRPLFLAEHIHYAESSLEELYGYRAGLNAGKINDDIERLLLSRGAVRTAGNVVHIYIEPDGNYELDYVCQTLYSGYTMLAAKCAATIEQYDLPMEGHRTAVSLSTAKYMARLAFQRGVQMVVRVNSSGNIVSVGDYPIAIAERGGVVVPMDTISSVETELLNRLCREAKVGLAVQTINMERFKSAEGVFIFGISGIQAISRCNGIAYSHSMASHLSRTLSSVGNPDNGWVCEISVQSSQQRRYPRQTRQRPR